MWGQLITIQGGHLKIRADWEKFKYEGSYKISWGFEKNRGGKAFRGPVTEGCLFAVKKEHNLNVIASCFVC